MKILNPVLILSAFVQIASTVIRAIHYTELMNNIHQVNGWILIGIILLHLILNWNWVKSVLFARKKA